jgi:hypothetical protein
MILVDLNLSSSPVASLTLKIFLDIIIISIIDKYTKPLVKYKEQEELHV